MTPHQVSQLDNLIGTPEYQAFCRVELDDPYPLLDELRSAAPVHWSPPLEAWVITSYQGVVAALGHPQLSSDRSAINARGIPDELRPGYGSLIAHIANWLGFIDPPKHSRLRRLAHSMINPALAATYRPWISAYVREVMNEMRRNEHVNLLDDLALRMPLALICTVLGVPDLQGDQFHRWTCDVGPVRRAGGSVLDQRGPAGGQPGQRELAGTGGHVPETDEREAAKARRRHDHQAGGRRRRGHDLG